MKKCGSCGVGPGSRHVYGCDIERCPRCGGQWVACDCIYIVCGLDPASLEETHRDVYENGPTDEMEAKWDAEWGEKRMPWMGEHPGAAECREYGFWCIWHWGWCSVRAGTLGATEDLNRLYTECTWDAAQQKMVRRRGETS